MSVNATTDLATVASTYNSHKKSAMGYHHGAFIKYSCMFTSFPDTPSTPLVNNP